MFLESSSWFPRLRECYDICTMYVQQYHGIFVQYYIITFPFSQLSSAPAQGLKTTRGFLRQAEPPFDHVDEDGCDVNGCCNFDDEKYHQRWSSTS